MSNEDILATVVGDSTESKSVSSDEKDEGEDEKLVSTKEAAQCFKKCLSWMESQNDIDPVQLMQLDFTMRSTIMDKSLGTNSNFWRFFTRAKQTVRREFIYTCSAPPPPLQCWTSVHAISPEFQHCMGGRGGGGESNAI